VKEPPPLEPPVDPTKPGDIRFDWVFESASIRGPIIILFDEAIFVPDLDNIQTAIHLEIEEATDDWEY